MPIDLAYEVSTLAEIAKAIIARDGNVNVIRCEQEWRRQHPKTAGQFRFVPATAVWETAFRMVGLVPDKARERVAWATGESLPRE